MQNTKIVSSIGFIATVVSIIIIAFIIIPVENRDNSFWVRILWTIFLLFLIWGYIAGFLHSILFPGKNKEDIGGVLPALGIAIFIYAFLSFTMMIIQAIFNDAKFLNKFHLVLQILLALGTIVSMIGLYFAQKGSKVGLYKATRAVKSPAHLVSLIRVEEDRFSQISRNCELPKETRIFLKELKSLREKIKYSLPHAGKIYENDEYLLFTDDVRDLGKSLSKIELSDSESKNKLEEIKKQVRTLIQKVGVVAEALRSNE